jgi:hypothetical protein
MPRVRRRGNAPKFKTATQRRIWEIVQDLHTQRKSIPAGPWTAPKTIVGALAAVQFKREIEMDGENLCRE